MLTFSRILLNFSISFVLIATFSICYMEYRGITNEIVLEKAYYSKEMENAIYRASTTTSENLIKFYREKLDMLKSHAFEDGYSHYKISVIHDEAYNKADLREIEKLRN